MKAGCGKTARPVWAAGGGQPFSGASPDPTLLTSGNAARGGPGRGKRGTVANRVVSEKHEGALKPDSVSTKQERIAGLARNNPAMALTSLNHYLDAEWMRYAYECTRKDGAVGVDGQTAEGYDRLGI